MKKFKNFPIIYKLYRTPGRSYRDATYVFRDTR